MRLAETLMKPAQKTMLLQLVAAKIDETDHSRRLAMAALGRAHPTVGKLQTALHRLHTLRVAVTEVAEVAA